jgi:hypothetical protein
MDGPSERSRIWADKAAREVYPVLGMMLGDLAWDTRAPQTIPRPDERLIAVLAEVFEAHAHELTKGQP